MSKRIQHFPYRRPEDMNLKLGKPRSIRFRGHNEAFLEECAKEAGIEFATFIRQLGEDYEEWLKAERAKSK